MWCDGRDRWSTNAKAIRHPEIPSCGPWASTSFIPSLMSILPGNIVSVKGITPNDMGHMICSWNNCFPSVIIFGSMLTLIAVGHNEWVRLDPHLLTEIRQTPIGYRTWITNCMQTKQWDGTTNSCSNLVKLPSNLGNGWVNYCSYQIIIHVVIYFLILSNILASNTLWLSTINYASIRFHSAVCPHITCAMIMTSCVSALLARCESDPQIIGGFPLPVMRSCRVSLMLTLQGVERIAEFTVIWDIIKLLNNDDCRRDILLPTIFEHKDDGINKHNQKLMFISCISLKLHVPGLNHLWLCHELIVIWWINVSSLNEYLMAISKH